MESMNLISCSTLPLCSSFTYFVSVPYHQSSCSAVYRLSLSVILFVRAGRTSF